MERFAGKVAIVTGGASGIGAATVARLASEGARVMVADMQEPAAGSSDAVRFQRTDVTSPAAVKALVDATIAAFGQLDILVNNAGTGAMATTPDMELGEWERVFAVNSTAVFLGCHEAIPHMRTRGGAIVNTASINGLVGNPAQPAYTAAKHGVVGLTRHAALRWATQGIRVNAVCPGVIATAMTAPLVENPDMRKVVEAMTPMGRFGTPEDIAEAVVWLCCDAAGFVTGHPMVIDGGATAV